MNSYELEDLILKEIREKIPNGSQFIDVFAYNKSVKLGGYLLEYDFNFQRESMIVKHLPPNIHTPVYA